MKNLATLLRDARDLIVSLKLTVVLILFSIILVLVATLDQVNLGIWVVQQKYFNTFVVFWKTGNMSLAIFPGGYTIGGLLLLNLLAAHFYRFKLTWRKLGLWLTHAGLILLLVGQLLTGLMQDEYQLRLDQGQTKNFSESYRNVELAITDTTDPKFDEVVAMIGQDEAQTLRRLSISVYERAMIIAADRGLILADTKFEFGIRADGQTVLGDEVLTPDSSRFWPEESWEPGHPQPSYDKQYVRDWLTSPESGWDRTSGEAPPALPDEVVERTREKYIEAYERLTGKRFA